MADDQDSPAEVFRLGSGSAICMDRELLPDGRYIIYFTAARDSSQVAEEAPEPKPDV